MDYRQELSALRRRLDALMLRVCAMDGGEFNEGEHPRDPDGKFAGGVTEAPKTTRDMTEFLGKEHTGVKGQDAINKLLEEKNGHVKGAFERSDIGKIDLVWGDDYAGLQHIIKRRKEEGEDVNWLLSGISEVIEKGKARLNNRGNYEIWHNGRMAIVAINFEKSKMTLMLSAFKRSKAPKD